MWNLKGTVLVACNCDYGCPCNFNAPPSHGRCEGGWTWNIGEGAVDGIPLDGLSFSVYVKWPGAIHEGNGEALTLIDERADARQEPAIARLLSGQIGGPWGTLAWTWPTVHGPLRVPYEVELDGITTRIKAGDLLDVVSAAIKNPVTGAEAHPAVILPEGIIVKQADLGCSTVFRLRGAVSMDHSGQYTAVGPFEYSG